MEYGDVYISDDGTRAVRWVSINRAKSHDFSCTQCAFYGTDCTVLKGWSVLVSVARKETAARERKGGMYSGWSPVCGRGVFVKAELLEAELHKIGGG